VTAGERFSCALGVSGQVYCWGAIDHGACGYGIPGVGPFGDDESVSEAPALDLSDSATTMCSGTFHSCAVLASGRIVCWGQNNFGQLGYGHTDTIGDDEPPSSQSAFFFGYGGRALGVYCGEYHTCAITDLGKVHCWGNNNVGQLGYGHTENIGDNEPASDAAPVELGPGLPVTMVMGSHATCAVMDSGDMYCWGQGARGQLGYASTDNVGDDESPQVQGPVDAGGRVISGGTTRHFEWRCGVFDDGAVRCWGRHDPYNLGYGYAVGQDIGDDEPAGVLGPIPVGANMQCMTTLGEGHICALTDDGRVRCMGDNAQGQLGYSNTLPVGQTDTMGVVGNVNLGIAV
jgi:hypothetical protein